MIHSSTDPEKADSGDRKDVTTFLENIPADEALAQYSDAEKTKAFQKLDWNLIPLYDLIPIYIDMSVQLLKLIASVFSICSPTLTEAMLEMPIRPVWVKNGASLLTSIPGLLPHTTWLISLFTGSSCCGNLCLYRFVVLPFRIPRRLTRSSVVGCPDGVWMGCGEYSPGRDCEFCRNSRTAVLDWTLRGWLCPWSCFVPFLLLSSIRDGLSIRPFHLVFSNCQLFCICTSLWYRSCQKLALPVAAFVYHWYVRGFDRQLWSAVRLC